MKLRKAERLTGCEIRRIGGASAKVSYGAYDSGGQLVAEATHLIDDLALCAVPGGDAFADSPQEVPVALGERIGWKISNRSARVATRSFIGWSGQSKSASSKGI